MDPKRARSAARAFWFLLFCAIAMLGLSVIDAVSLQDYRPRDVPPMLKVSVFVRLALLISTIRVAVLLRRLWPSSKWKRRASATRNWLIALTALLVAPIGLAPLMIALGNPVIALIALILLVLGCYACSFGALLGFTAMAGSIAAICRSDRLKRWSDRTRRTLIGLIIWYVTVPPVIWLLIACDGMERLWDLQTSMIIQAGAALGFLAAAAVPIYAFVRICVMFALSAVTLQQAAANPPAEAHPAAILPTFIPPRPKNG